MTLERAPAIGYRVHGSAWRRHVDPAGGEGVRFARRASQAEGVGHEVAGVYSPCWGGHDEADVAERAEAIVSVVRIAEALGADHVTSTGASPRGEPGGLERVIACVRDVLARIPARTPVRLALEPHFGNVLEQPEDFERSWRPSATIRGWACASTRATSTRLPSTRWASSAAAPGEFTMSTSRTTWARFPWVSAAAKSTWRLS